MSTTASPALTPVQIDIGKVIQDKNPALYRLLPNGVLRWLKRTIHEEEINEGLRRSVGLKDLDFARFTLEYLQATTSSSGIENIPRSGGVVIAANHPLGGLDGVALMHVAGQVRSDIRFIVNDILTRLPGFDTIVVGVNKHGTNPRAGLEAIESAYAGGNAVLVFPAGLCSRKMDDGTIRDLVWQKSFVTKAQKYNLPIVPTFNAGANSSWFYNLARWRKKLGIKANLEMFYLPDEMFKQRGHNIHITFGRPVEARFFDKQRRADEWAGLLREFIYLLPSQPALRFEEFVEQKFATSNS